MIARTAGNNAAAASAALSVPAFGSFDIRTQDCIDFLRGLPPGSVDLIVTDPAYSGMNRHMRFGHGRIVGHYGKPDNARWFHEFSDDPDSYAAFLGECQRVLRQDRHVYIMFDSFSMLSLGALVRDFFDVKGVVVWDKVHLGMGHYFRRRHEQIVFASKGRRKLSRRDLPDVWAVPRIHRAAYPTQKPVKLFELMVEASAEPGFLVCDPFCGSGSSGVAALLHGCDFIGADIDARAVDIAGDRLAALVATGQDPLEPAVRLPVGRPAAEVVSRPRQ
jgi:site-specific DNA-methyltransferase (adenine-specific)